MHNDCSSQGRRFYTFEPKDEAAWVRSQIPRSKIENQFRLFGRDVASRKMRSAINNYFSVGLGVVTSLAMLGGAGTFVHYRRSIFENFAQAAPHDVTLYPAMFIASYCVIAAIIMASEVVRPSLRQARQDRQDANILRKQIYPISNKL